MRNRLLHFAAVAMAPAVMFGVSFIEAQAPPEPASLTPAQTPAIAAEAMAEPPASAGPEEGVYDPVADPRAVVTFGHARFTVLTPELIRMEWAANGHFEDRPSLVFLNRRLPVPRFNHLIENNMLIIQTAAVRIVYGPDTGPKSNPDGRFTPENLTVSLSVGNKLAVWRPGMVDEQNLMGTTRTLDGAVGEKNREPIEQGSAARRTLKT